MPHNSLINNYTHTHSQNYGARSKERLCDTLLKRNTGKLHMRRFSPYTSQTHHRSHSPLRSQIRESPSPPVRTRAGESKDFVPGRERYYSPTSRRLYDVPSEWHGGESSYDDVNHHNFYSDNNSYANNNSEWTDGGPLARRDRYRSRDYDEDDHTMRFRSPPRQYGSISLQSLNKRMDQFDSILGKLVSEVSDRKKRYNERSVSPSARSNNDRSRATEDIDRLDRMMEELNILKNNYQSPQTDHYRPISHLRGDSSAFSNSGRDRHRH